jgi:hypothetical protein
VGHDATIPSSYIFLYYYKTQGRVDTGPVGGGIDACRGSERDNQRERTDDELVVGMHHQCMVKATTGASLFFTQTTLRAVCA